MRTAIAGVLIGALLSGAGFSGFLRVAFAAGSLKVEPAPGTDVRNLIPPFDPRIDAVHAPRGFGTGRIWLVGPDQPYRKPSDVVSLVHDGDIVEIQFAHYFCDTGVKWSANYLTLVGVGGRPVIDATGCSIAGDKGSWNPRGQGLIVANFEFMGAAGASHNDAGIRYDGSGYVYIADSYFHDNESGLLATPNDGQATNIVIAGCEFAHNGAGGGYSHNVYISYNYGTKPPNSFVMRFSYSHDAHHGHLLKSRAARNYIFYNRLADDPDGGSIHVIDLPQGGLSYIIGNVLQHGRNAVKPGIVSYSSELPHNPIQEVYLANNTFISGLKDDTALDLFDKVRTAKIIDNLVVGISPSNLVSISSAKVTLSNNMITTTPRFVDEIHQDYHLTASSPALNAGIDPGSIDGFSMTPAYEFQGPGKAVPRANSLDVGAFAAQ